MADVGLDASLELDIAAALRQVDTLERRLDEATTIVLRADASLITRAIDAAIAAADDEVAIAANADRVTGQIDSAVDAADDRVTVEADTTGVTGEVDAAINAADTSLDVNADASAITGVIDGAVDAADTDVTVSGDASQVTGSIDAAIDSADTNLQVTADGSGAVTAVQQALSDSNPYGPISVGGDLDPQLATGLANVVASLGDAADEGEAFKGTLATLGAAGAAAGLYSLVTAASDLEQAVGGTTAIFGESQTAVVGFARNAADAAGLTEESARSLTSQLGGLLQGFGFTQDQAAELSITLAQLGADLAATFGGSTVDAVQAIGAALRGETDPIERYGISLNAAAIEARALETGLASNKDELTANAKAQSALAIITEQAANAQGQFAREADTTAGQLERAKAEAGNMAAAVGAELQPAMNELLSLARSELIPALGDLGESLGPALADVVLALAPAFGSFSSILVAVSPAVEALAGAVSAIPDPVLATVGAFLAFNKVAGVASSGLSLLARSLTSVAVPAGSVSGALNVAGGSAKGLLGGINPLTVALVAGAAAFTVWSGRQAEAREVERAHEAQVDSFTSTLADADSAVEGYADALEGLVKAGDDLKLSIFGGFDVDVAQVFSDAGVSAERFAEVVGQGGDALDRFLATVQGGSEARTQLLRASLSELATSLEEATVQSIDAGVALGDYTRAQADAAIESTRNSDGSRNYAAALDELEQSAKASAEQQDALAAAVGGVDSEGATRQVTELGLRLADLRGPVEGLDSRFAAFALAADAAGLSGADLEAVAAELGTSADQLGPAIEKVAGPINDMASAAANAAPDLSSLAGPIEEFSTEGFRDELQKSYEALVNFRDNLTILSDFSPRLAAAAAELGPQYTETLAQALRDGNTDVLNESALLLAGIEEQQQGLVDDTRNIHGPALVEEMGLTAQGMTDAFGRELDLVTPTRESIRSVDGAVEEEGPGFIGAINQVATDATAAFGGSFTPDPRPGLVNADAQVQAAQPSWLMRLAVFGDQGDQGFRAGFTPDPRPGLVNADAQVQGRGPSFFARLNIFGGQGRSGFRSGISGMSGDAAGATDSAVGAVSSRGQAAYSGGYGVGQNVGSGFVAGIQSMVAAAQAQVGSFMDAALNAAKRKAGIASPSKVWRDQVGAEIVSGLIGGLEAGVADAERASASLVDQALAAAQVSVDSVAPIAFDPAVTAGLSGVASGGTVINLAAGAVVINVPPGSTPAQAQALGGAAYRGFEKAAAKRRVAATARMAGAR